MTDISPLRRGETKPDKQTNPEPPVGGWAGRQTLSGNCTTPVRGVNLDRGVASRWSWWLSYGFLTTSIA